MIDKIKLIDSALEAQLKAICPYSNYPVGAALLSDDNNIIIGFNIELNEIVWENPIPDKFVANPIIVNNMIFLTSSRVGKQQSGEPTLYAYNILTGGSIFGKEFPRDNENQIMVVKIIEEYNSIANDNSTILLVLNHSQLGGGGEKYKEIACS